MVDGSVISVPFDKLSTEDQKFLDKQSKTLAGKAVSIIDGDTFVLLDADKTQHKIRLEGIDAPEDSQAFSAKSTLALAELIRNKDVRVVWKEKDRYGRILGHVYVGAKWVNLELIKMGWAWHYKESNKDLQLAQAEVGATTAKAGLWSDDSPIAPWDYRKGIRPDIKAVSGTVYNPSAPSARPKSSRSTRDARSGSPRTAGNASSTVPLGLMGPSPGTQEPTQQGAAPNTVVYVTETGSKYHLNGCQYLRKSQIATPLWKAQMNLSPCSNCKPPF